VIAALEAPGVMLAPDALIALRRVALRSRAAPVLAALPGGFATRRKGHGQEVADVRCYVVGDDIRHLDRGTTARTGTLHVRQFQEERDRVALLIADFRAPMLWGVTRAFRSVVAAEALCLLGWRVVEDGGRVGLLALTSAGPVAVAPRGRTRGMLDVIGGLVRAHAAALDAVARGASQGGDAGDQAGALVPLDAALAPVERCAPAGAELLLASGFDGCGEGLADRLSALARRRVPRLILIGDADAARLPRGRYPVRLPDGRRLRVALDGAPGRQPVSPDSVVIAGRPALTLDAGASVDELARRLAGAFPQDRTP
jgi:uncharacterized protein (DUF58 family)